jgi:hypothetical protein
VAVAGWAFRALPEVTPATRFRPSQTLHHVERPARVRLEALSGQPSEVDGTGRNPFSTRPKPAVLVSPTLPRLQTEHAAVSVPSYAAPTISAPFKFMGILQKRSGETWGVFADCAGYTRAAREGESVLGAWRVLRIGAESVFVESLDGRGVTIPMAGCGPRS